MKCEIEYSLATGRITLFAPFSSIELSPSAISKLVPILETIAMAEAAESAVERAVVNHDLKAMLTEIQAKWAESDWKETGCGQMREMHPQLWTCKSCGFVQEWRHEFCVCREPRPKPRKFKENGKAQAPTLEELGL